MDALYQISHFGCIDNMAQLKIRRFKKFSLHQCVDRCSNSSKRAVFNPEWCVDFFPALGGCGCRVYWPLFPTPTLILAFSSFSVCKTGPAGHKTSDCNSRERMLTFRSSLNLSSHLASEVKYSINVVLWLVLCNSSFTQHLNVGHLKIFNGLLKCWQYSQPGFCGLCGCIWTEANNNNNSGARLDQRERESEREKEIRQTSGHQSYYLVIFCERKWGFQSAKLICWSFQTRVIKLFVIVFCVHTHTQ